jgi:Cof subfamily protein (haloacid dehalogenase superfamily)
VAAVSAPRTLYVSDLDGTLLGPDATLSPRSRDALTALLGRGLAFTVATARSLTSIRQLLGDLPLALPVIAHNGAVVGDLATGVARSVTALDGGALVDVLAIARSVGLQPLFTTWEAGREHLYAQPATNAGQAAYLAGRRETGDERLREVDDVAVALREPVLAVTLIGAADAVAAVHAAVAGRADLHGHLFDDLYAPGWRWLTLQAAGTSKATGIRALPGTWDRLVVFGDQVNDLEMFALADHAVATAGAAPEVLAAAHEVIGSNADDAVARWLEARSR